MFAVNDIGLILQLRTSLSITTDNLPPLSCSITVFNAKQSFICFIVQLHYLCLKKLQNGKSGLEFHVRILI